MSRIHFILLLLFNSFPEYSGYALYHETSPDNNQDSPPVAVTQIYGVTGFTIFPFSTLSLHCHYFAFVFRSSLLAFEVADCISAGGCRQTASSKGRGQGHSVPFEDASV